jgi:hypothetical protein
MEVSEEGIRINRRFFEALDEIKERGIIRGMQTFTNEYNINRWNLITVRKEPEKRVLKPEWMHYIVKGYGVSADWLLTGRGNMFKP